MRKLRPGDTVRSCGFWPLLDTRSVLLVVSVSGPSASRARVLRAGGETIVTWARRIKRLRG